MSAARPGAGTDRPVGGELSIRPATEADEPAILDLLTTTMAGGPTGERSADFFRWKHRSNPFGASLSLVALSDGELVGFRTFMRWRFLRHGLPLTAVRAVDTATSPAHQGRGIFTRLTRAAIELAATDTDLIFNTPISNSLPGYLKMGWREVGSVPIAIRVVRPLAFARGFRSAGHGEPAGPPPSILLPPAHEVLSDRAEVQRLLDAAVVPSDRLHTDRDSEYLWWRYASAPGLDYRAVALRRGGDLVGLAIGRPRRRGPLAELTLSEVIVAGDDRAAARGLLRAVARARVDHVASSLRGWPTAEGVRRRLGYVDVPGRGMTLVANPLRPGAGDVFNRDAWALSLGDLEVF